MKKASRQYQWINQKYGESVKPYEAMIMVDNSKAIENGRPMVIEYNYSMLSGVRNEEEWERNPQRRVEIWPPASYKG